jgi:hypothetical protein
MRSYTRPEMTRTLTAVALSCALVACSAKTPSGDPSGTATATAPTSASPSASAKPPRIPSARFAVYASRGRLFLYDVRADSLRDVAHGAGLRMPAFVNDHEVSFVQGTQPAVLRIIDIKTGVVRDVFTQPTGIDVYGWTPDRLVVAYITTDSHSYPHLRYRYMDSDVPEQSVATLARAFGREGFSADQIKIEWSPSGNDVLVVYTPADGSPSEDISPEQSQLQIRSFNGDLALAADMEDGPTMGTWAADGSRVYFRTDRGARAWRADSGVLEGVRGGSRWFNPWPSRDGRWLAYDTGSDSTQVHVSVIDLAKGARRIVSRAGRFHPVFATQKIVWVQRVKPCTDCLGATAITAEVYALDINSGVEKRLALRSLDGIDVYYR